VRGQEFRIPYKSGQTFRFIPFSDVHLGHKLSSVSNFQKEVINKYKDDKDTYFLDIGDGCDLILSQTNDPRFKASMVDSSYVGIDNPVDRLVDDYCDLLAPIAPRIISMVDSNHHLELMKRTGTNVTRRIAEKLWGSKIANDGIGARLHSYAGFLRLKFGYATPCHKTAHHGRAITWYLSHGITTGGRTLGGPITSISNVARGRRADIFIFAHNHQLSSTDSLELAMAGNCDIVSEKEIFINTGCYKKSRSDDQDTSWEEQKEFAANAMGHIEVYIHHERLSMDIYTIKRMIL
jgi:hypothetical protein